MSRFCGTLVSSLQVWRVNSFQLQLWVISLQWGGDQGGLIRRRVITYFSSQTSKMLIRLNNTTLADPFQTIRGCLSFSFFFWWVNKCSLAIPCWQGKTETAAVRCSLHACSVLMWCDCLILVYAAGGKAWAACLMPQGTAVSLKGRLC